MEARADIEAVSDRRMHHGDPAGREVTAGRREAHQQRRGTELPLRVDHETMAGDVVGHAPGVHAVPGGRGAGASASSIRREVVGRGLESGARPFEAHTSLVLVLVQDEPKRDEPMAQG